MEGQSTLNNEVQNNSNLPKERNKFKIFLIIIGLLTIIGAAFLYFTSKDSKEETEFVCVKNDTEIYERFKNATVLVKHTFQCKVKINDKEFTINFPDAPLETIYGTGFFIESQSNEPNPIITNRHVIVPWEDETQSEEYNKRMNNVRMKIASILTTDISPDDYQSFIESNWEKGRISFEGESEGYEGEGEELVASSSQNDTSDNFDKTQAADDIASTIEEKIYISIDNIEVTMETTSLSIAFHNSNDVWYNCSILQVSNEPNIDLAAIISEEVSQNYISGNGIEENESAIIPGQKVFMLGFPMGEEFAKSENGYKVQFYKGEVSRESDGVKIQYSIPSAGGASGSPVFNECGKLIAVNFGGIEKMENYNFGVLAKFVSNLVYKGAFKVQEESAASAAK